MKKYLFLLWSLAARSYSLRAQQPPIAIKSSTTRHGPEKGALIIIGGGGSTPEIWKKFTELAGGKEKVKIVFVTTGTPGDDTSSHSYANTIKKETGIQNVVTLNTNNIKDYSASSGPFFLLSQGQRYDLKYRKVIADPAKKEPSKTSDGDDGEDE